MCAPVDYAVVRYQTATFVLLRQDAGKGLGNPQAGSSMERNTCAIQRYFEKLLVPAWGQQSRTNSRTS